MTTIYIISVSLTLNLMLIIMFIILLTKVYLQEREILKEIRKNVNSRKSKDTI